jgi:hypothetical protein
MLIAFVIPADKGQAPLAAELAELCPKLLVHILCKTWIRCSNLCDRALNLLDRTETNLSAEEEVCELCLRLRCWTCRSDAQPRNGLSNIVQAKTVVTRNLQGLGAISIACERFRAC